jgi:hypothetical protein
MIKYIIIVIILILAFDYLLTCNYSNQNENFEDIPVLDNYKSTDVTVRLLKEVKTILESKDINYWIHTEALLGAVNYKKIHPWGDNIDLCILDTDEDKLLTIKKILNDKNLGIIEFFAGYRIFELNGKELSKVNYLYPFITILLFTESNNKITIKSQSALKFWPKETFDKSDIFPLKKYDFEDTQLNGPNNPKNILEQVYNSWPINLSEQPILRGYFKADNSIVYNKIKKPYLWQYWDNIDGKETPAFISLCLKTVDIHCSNSFEIVRLTKNNIFKYIPELEKYKDKMDKLIIAHKVDIYRILLLHKYGGIYMDADIICLKDPIEIMHKLNDYDFVGFGCTGNNCQMGYAKPSNWILASQPNSILMGRVLKNVLDKVENKKDFDYHDLGKMVIWEEMDNLIKNNDYKYFHYPNKVDGSRDKHGNWIDTSVVFSNYPVEYENESIMMFYVFYNSGITPEVKGMSESELLSQDWNYTKFLKKGLNI